METEAHREYKVTAWGSSGARTVCVLNNDSLVSALAHLLHAKRQETADIHAIQMRKQTATLRA
eukprot:6117452-Amphidinium_carterae.1